jgi:hypothetical protein
MDDEYPTTMIGSPVDLAQAKFVEIKIAGDRVWVNTEHGLAFRAYRVGKIIVQDERAPSTDQSFFEGVRRFRARGIRSAKHVPGQDQESGDPPQ